MDRGGSRVYAATCISPSSLHNRDQNYYDFTSGQVMPLNYTPLKAILGEFYFIYGTLRKGHRNRHLLLADKLKLIAARVNISNFSLIEVMPGVPAAVHYRDTYICGDIYDIGKDNIELMDIIERGYEKIKVIIHYNGSYIDCYMWVWTKDYDKKQLLPYPEWDMNIEDASYKNGLSKMYRS